MKERRLAICVKESRCLVKIGTQGKCIAHSGASSLKSKDPGDDVDYVTVKYNSTCRG